MQKVTDKKESRNLEAQELDKVLKNIREQLMTGNKKLKTITPDLIDQIYKFENLNDFTIQADLDELLADQLELIAKY